MGRVVDAHDPKGLIREAYAMAGIGEAECRSIFIDWALSVEGAPEPHIRALLARYGAAGHPMTALLEAALEGPLVPRRRGGRRGARSAEN